MTHSFKVVIPARYSSTRLPAKPLLDIAGKPMLYHTWQAALQSDAEQVVIATDDQRIFDVMKSFGADVCMTRKDHVSGTDRIAEVAKLQSWNDDAIIVNLQGDEPLTPPQLLQQVAQGLAQHSAASMATLSTPIIHDEDIHNSNVVKLVTDKLGYALYFSRASIPWYRDAFADDINNVPSQHIFQRHIGIYAYRVSFLKDYGLLEAANLEQIESLEQLRVLWHGYRIHVSVTAVMPGHGIDTQQDLDRVRKMFANTQ